MKEEHLSSAAPSREPFKDVLLRNLDYLIAGLALILLGLQLTGFLLGPPDDLDSLNAELDSGLTDVNTHLSDTRYGITDYQKRVAAVIDEVRDTWGKLPATKVTAREGLAWPTVLVAQRRAGESNVMSLFAPQDVRGAARFGANRIEWSTHEDNNVPLSGFKILRKDGKAASSRGDAAKPTAAGSVEGDVFQFDDVNVRPGREYTYYVVALTDEAAAAGQQSESERSLPVTVEAVADFRIAILDADPEAKTATFKVEKWHNDNWFSKSFTAKVGGTLGAKDVGSGVDYTTGRRVKSLGFEDAFKETSREEVVFDGEAKVRMADGSPVTEKVVSREPFKKVTVEVEGGGLPPKTLTHEKTS